MADSFVQVAPDSTGKKVDTSQLVDGANTVERQRVVLGDDTDVNSLARVTSDGELVVEGSAIAMMLMLLAEIRDKLPRLDANDRLVTNPSEIAPATTPVSGSLTTVTTVTTAADVTRLNSMGAAAATARPTDAIPIHLGNMGALHIYNNITVT